MAEVVGIEPEEAEAFQAIAHAAFHVDDPPGTAAPWLEPERALVVRDGGRIVATAAASTRVLTVPGGASVPLAAVVDVTVEPPHRGRGLLRALMRRQLDDLHAGLEPVAALWASEGAIYGRFGYGLATWSVAAEVEVLRARVREDAPRPAAAAALVLPASGARAALEGVHERVRAARPGAVSRPPAWWDRILEDVPGARRAGGALRAAVQDGEDGEPAAFALLEVTPEWDARGPDGTVHVRELLAATPEGAAGLWRLLLRLGLVRRIEVPHAPLDDPLPHLLEEPLAVVRRVRPGLFVRLVDVPAALAGRGYDGPAGELVLEVEDAVCPWNAGRHRLAWDGPDAACEPARAAAPDLALDAAALGAAYLGGTSIATLAAAGRVAELRPGAVARAAAAFGGPVAPWCPDRF